MNDNNLNNQNVDMNTQASVPEVNSIPPVVSETPVVETAPVTEVAPVVESTPVVETAPVAEVAPGVVQTPVVDAVPTTPVQPMPSVENNVPAGGTNNVPQNGNTSSDDKKKLYIIIGIVALIVVVVIILFLTVFKDKNSGNDYDDYVKEEQKTFEDLNKHFTYKEFKISNGILVEINNDNNVPVIADVKVEFLDANGGLVDVSDSSSSTIDKKNKSYVFISTYDIDYSSYKMTVKLNKSYSDKLYIDSIEVVSSNLVDDTYLIQLKNNSDKKLDIYAGMLFYQDENIIGFSNAYLSDILAGETSSEKVYIPTDDNYDPIKYTKAEVVVLSAYDL